MSPSSWPQTYCYPLEDLPHMYIYHIIRVSITIKLFVDGSLDAFQQDIVDFFSSKRTTDPFRLTAATMRPPTLNEIELVLLGTTEGPTSFEVSLTVFLKSI